MNSLSHIPESSSNTPTLDTSHPANPGNPANLEKSPHSMNSTHPRNSVHPENSAPLHFTGNWFIDAGILGFVNLMEEVYGWDLEELQRRIREEPDVVYYGYFPFAYFYDLSQKRNEELKVELINFIEKNKNLGKDILEKVWWTYITELFRESWIGKKLQVMHEAECYDKKGKAKPHYADIKYRELVKKREDFINDLVKNFDNKILELLGRRKKLTNKNGTHNLSVDDIKLFEKFLNNPSEDDDFYKNVKKVVAIHKELENYLNRIWDDVKSKNISEKNGVFCRIPVDSSFFKNYLFFNNARGIFEQLKDLRNLIDGNTSYSDYLSKIDKALSKFLPSDKEFSNISYTGFRTKTIAKRVPYLFVYFINFLNAFVRVGSVGSIFFYGNNLFFTYGVNKKIRTYLDNLNRNNQVNSLSILRITWQAVIDMVLEAQTIWSLENMYLIRYEKLSQQDLIGVEYIGIPKLQASIILDDTLRDVLNRNIPTPRKDKNKRRVWIWLLEEFVKNRPLLDHILLYIHGLISDTWQGSEKYISRNTMITAIAVDAKIKEMSLNKVYGEPIFGESFFSNYREIVNDVKSSISRMHYASYLIQELVKENENRKKIALILFGKIRANDKYGFVNGVLKYISGISKQEDVKRIVGYLFEDILRNEVTWENYAISIVIGLVVGGRKND